MKSKIGIVTVVNSEGEEMSRKERRCSGEMIPEKDEDDAKISNAVYQQPS